MQLAPWSAIIRYDLAKAYEAGGDYDQTIRNLKLYLLFKLPDDEARTVQDKVYMLKAKQKMKEESALNKQAAEQKAADEVAAKKADLVDANNNFYSKIKGDWMIGNGQVWISIKKTGDLILLYYHTGSSTCGEKLVLADITKITETEIEAKYTDGCTFTRRDGVQGDLRTDHEVKLSIASDDNLLEVDRFHMRRDPDYLQTTKRLLNH